MSVVHAYAGFNVSPAVKSDMYIDPLAQDHIRDVTHLPLVIREVELSPFNRVSAGHGRSIEDPSGLIISQEPLHDENGDIYTAFSIKGAEIFAPRLSASTIEPSGVRVYGMLDASTFLRCSEMSRRLRAAGVLTEWPLYNARPRFFNNLKENSYAFKTQLYGRYVEELKALRRRETVESIGQVGLVGQGLADMQFSVMYRAMLSNARMADFDDLSEQPQELVNRISAAIRSLQLRKPVHFKVWEQLEQLDPEKHEDRLVYATEVLPKIMGENLAKFHNAGAYHKYLHAGNWTLAGEIVDLDSVRHAEFEPEDVGEITVPNLMKDVLVAHNAFLPMIHAYAGDPREIVNHFRTAYAAERLKADDLTLSERLILKIQFNDSNKEGKDQQRGMPYLIDPTVAEDHNLLKNLTTDAMRLVMLGETAYTASLHMLLSGGNDVKIFQNTIRARLVETLKIDGFSEVPVWLDTELITRTQLYLAIRIVCDAAHVVAQGLAPKILSTA